MALAADRTDAIHRGVIEQRSFAVAASTTIYLGALVSFDADGYLVPAADAAAQDSKAVFLALEGVDNSSGSDGDEEVLCMTRGTALVAIGSIVQADLGKVAHVADDEDVALTSTNNRDIGSITGIETNQVAVAIG